MGSRNLSQRRARKSRQAKDDLARKGYTPPKPKAPRKSAMSTLRESIALMGAGAREVRAFVKLARQHPALNNLQKQLSYLGMSFGEFLRRINVEKLLTSKFSPKGLINEIFILGDKILVGHMMDRADGSFKNLFRYNEKELAGAVGNPAKKAFKLKEFDHLDSALATDFRTLPDNKLYFDFSMVRYDPATKQLLILIPGEIKEPRAAAELAKQFGRFVRRLSNAGEISFKLNGDTIKVKSSDVFYIKNNAVGIGRTEKRYGFRTGKNIRETTPVMELTHAKFKRTSPEVSTAKDSQEFIRFLVRLDKDLNPDKLERALREVKRQLLRMSPKEVEGL